MIYLDSSVVLARLLAEPHHAPDHIWDDVLVSSRLLKYEVWNRIHVMQFAGRLGETAEAILDRITFLELSSDILVRALNPFPVRVRTLDSLHLASIEYLRGQGYDVKLASFDNRMNAAARALGADLCPL